MNRSFPPRRPPDGRGDLLDRLGRWLRELAEGAERAAEDLIRTARERWPDARDRGRAALDDVGRGFDRISRRVDARVASAVSAAADGWRRVRPGIRRAAKAVRRRAPSRRRALVIAAVLFGTVWVLWERCGVGGCPDVDGLRSYQPGGASVLLDRDGERFADLAPMEYEVVPLDSLPDYVPAAFVAVEDRRFYEHGGVDWRRVLGAAWADVRAGGLVQGSSTIPMQLSRTLFSDRIRREEKTFRRKLMEVRVAGEIEEAFTKDEILELYLNHVYLGGGSYGIRAASRYYFGKDATALTLEEAATLAALPRAPAHYDPRRNPEASRTRRDLVLTLMVEQGRVAAEDAESARARELAVSAEPDHGGEDRLAAYFVAHVRRLLEERLGESLYAEALTVYTTLDTEAQRAAEDELEAQLQAVERGAFGWLSAPAYPGNGARGEDGTDYLQGALVVLDARTGDVRAWVGGRNYHDSRFDRARLSRRQAGSAFKPFVYGAALEAGLSPSQPIMDAPYRLARTGGEDWEPENYSGRFDGRMSLRDALVRSQNVPAVRLAAAVGTDHVRDFAGRAGLGGEVPGSPVAALGVTVTSPLELATAYAAFAARGRRPTPRFVVRVEDEDGAVLLETRPADAVEVMDPATAYLLTDMLRDVVDRGTGAAVRRVGFRGPAAGKTGTTSDATDVWFVGYTPELVGAVWVGFDEVQPLPSRATGGGVAAPVWGRVMARAYRDRAVPGWPDRPRDVVALRVDPETGLVLEEGCRPRRGASRRELFLESQRPVTVCPRRGRRSVFGEVGGWLESVFGSRRPPPQIPGERDPDLGFPRLPRRDNGDAGPGEARTEGVREPDQGRARERERVREARRHEQERIRESRKRAVEELREALKRREEAAREARKRAEERRRDGGGG